MMLWTAFADAFIDVILRFLEIEALAGLLKVAPAFMATSMGAMSELFSFSSSDISSDCDAMTRTAATKDGRRQALCCSE